MPGETPSETRPRPRLVRAALAGIAAALLVAGIGALVLHEMRDRTALERARLRELSTRAIKERDANAFVALLLYAESGPVQELRPAAASAWLQAVAFIRVDSPEVRGVIERLRASSEGALAAEAAKVLDALAREARPRTPEDFFGEAKAPEVRAAMKGFVERRGQGN